VVQWRLRRNCAIGPRQTLIGFAGLCAFNVLIGAAFLLLGYPLVMLFIVLVLAGFALALLAYARHAGDCETLTLDDGRLTIEQCCGAHVTRTELQAAWVRVVVPREASDLVALCERRRSVQVGRHLLPELRPRMAHELRQALDVQRAGA
jgi:uncharacterized membrane protein